jgi:hypothetical protein
MADSSVDNALLAAIQIAAQEASSRVQAAVESAKLAADATKEASKNSADAQRDCSQTQADAQRDVADTTADAQKDVAGTHAGAAKYSADKNLEGVKYAADRQKDTTIEVANTRAVVDENVANIMKEWQEYDADKRLEGVKYAADKQEQGVEREAQAQETVADTRANADRDVAGTQKDATEYVADKRLEGDKYQADRQKEMADVRAQADEYVADSQADAQRDVAATRKEADVQVAGIQLTGQEYTADKSSGASMYGDDRRLDGTRYASDSETDRVKLKLGFAEDKWAQIFPLISAWMNRNPNSGGDGANWSDLVSAVGGAPWIDASGYWTPAQVQAQVNAIYARSAARTQSLTREAQVDLAGRGFAASSPLLAMLSAGYEGDGLRTSTEDAVKLLLQAATMNGEATAKGQELRQKQLADAQRAFYELHRNLVQLNVGLFGGVAQMLAGIA